MRGDTLPPSRAPLSPRRRRLRWAGVWLGLVAGVGLLSGVTIYLRSRPTEYRPDEQSADITSSLARKLPPEAPTPRFTDVTAAAGLASFRNFAGNRTSQLPEDMGPGLAWGDFDNDGDDDLFAVSAGGSMRLPEDQLLPCVLYENRGDATFRLAPNFPATRIHGMGAAWGDYDGDGFVDLAVTGFNALLLFHNEGGTGRFTLNERFASRDGFWSSATWGDYDNDRFLDLYVCGYVQYNGSEADRDRGSQQLGSFVPFTLNPSSFAGGTNLMFHNRGDGTFEEVGVALRVRNPEGRSLGGLWRDFDDDGWLDLYVANDISDNVLFRNTGGRFEDISHPALVADYRSAMGLAAGDYNRDNDEDLFITHWVAQENALYDNLWADFNGRRGEMGKGTNVGGLKATNSLALQSSNAPAHYPLRFMDFNEMKGLGQISLPFVGWGTEFGDFDGDGWLDLIVANGNTLEFPGAYPKKLKPQEPFLFWNQRGEHFHNVAQLSGPLTNQHNSRGLALADFDNDGDLDIALAHLGEGLQLLRNEMQTGHWLKLRLRSKTKSGALGFGDGAKVIAWLGNVPLRRTVTSVSYLSQSSRTPHFGLGALTRVDRVEVRWLGGGTNFFENLEADATYELTENELAPRKIVPAPGVYAASPAQTASTGSVRQRQLDFWEKQRAAMNAMKVDKDHAKAIALFREALRLNPNHEDSRYYLGRCLASEGDVAGALTQLDELKRINPQSHRAWQQWGVLRALFATNHIDLDAAEQSLERAHDINPEETGALLVLGEISLLRGDVAKANERLSAACRTNPRAANGIFLRAYIAWKRGEVSQSVQQLEAMRTALGKEWQPRGSTSEGDVTLKQHIETTPLRRFSENWTGSLQPETAFASLDAYLTRALQP